MGEGFSYLWSWPLSHIESALWLRALGKECVVRGCFAGEVRAGARLTPKLMVWPLFLGSGPESPSLGIGLGHNSVRLPQLTQLLVLGKYWGCMQRLASCPDPWLPRVPGADAEVEAVTALASLSVGILAEDR